MTDPHYHDADEAMSAPHEPVNPCRVFESRACVDITNDDNRRYRVTPCALGHCSRFPHIDKAYMYKKG